MKHYIQATFLAAISFCLLTTGCQNNDTESATVIPPGDAATSTGSTTGAAPPTGRQRTYSGLQYEVLRPGTGPRPSSYSRVTVHYHGYLPNGTVFDSSVQRGQPSTFGLNQVIAGWQEGIPLMKEGAKYRFIIPPHLGYGAQGSPPKIGPNQTLMFDVDLIKVL
tara:strand:- start:1194 stop:1685 length:492 start_codon:yes stop_codon:yes gene_type:complete